jgi:hypothetical protein
MKRSKEEAEVIVRLDYQEGLAHITVHAWPAMAAKMEKQYGASLDGQSEQSRRWRVPLKAISFRSGRPRQPKQGSKTPVLASAVAS